jgi:hypothetical protein
MASPRRRRCPDDFEIVFVEKGRVECEAWYRTSRRTVSRWLKERVKTRLVAERGRFWRYLRKIHAGRRRQSHEGGNHELRT